jgi:hypothetical protein
MRSRTKETSNLDSGLSFRNPPEGTDSPPALSAPVGHRSILAEVRAPLPPRPTNPIVQPHQTPAVRPYWNERIQPQTRQDLESSLPISRPNTRRGGTMSRGNIGGKSARMDAFTWLSSVKVGDRRENSSCPGSGNDSGHGSRLSSRSRPPSSSEKALGFKRRSDSTSRAVDDRREGEGNQSLQDEYVVGQV